jgi:MYXO-CTERM domain-containing protein
MGARIRMILISACMAGTCSANTIISATHVIAGLDDSFAVINTYDQDFTLTVQGGSGSGFFNPIVSAHGGNTDLTFGNQTATAFIGWQSGGRSGAIFVPDIFGNPQAQCGPGICNGLPFTFGVAQDFHLMAEAHVAYSRGIDSKPFVQTTLTASADFGGLVFSQFGLPLFSGVTYTLDPVVIGGISDQAATPEPGSVMLALAGLVLLPLRRYRRGRSRIPSSHLLTPQVPSESGEPMSWEYPSSLKSR